MALGLVIDREFIRSKQWIGIAVVVSIYCIFSAMLIREYRSGGLGAGSWLEVAGLLLLIAAGLAVAVFFGIRRAGRQVVEMSALSLSFTTVGPKELGLGGRHGVRLGRSSSGKYWLLTSSHRPGQSHKLPVKAFPSLPLFLASCCPNVTFEPEAEPDLSDPYPVGLLVFDAFGGAGMLDVMGTEAVFLPGQLRLVLEPGAVKPKIEAGRRRMDGALTVRLENGGDEPLAVRRHGILLADAYRGGPDDGRSLPDPAEQRPDGDAREGFTLAPGESKACRFSSFEVYPSLLVLRYEVAGDEAEQVLALMWGRSGGGAWKDLIPIQGLGRPPRAKEQSVSAPTPAPAARGD